MKKKFRDLKVGDTFYLPDDRLNYYGEKEPLVKIPFLANYYRTTGYKRNAKLKYAPKYFYIDDEQEVEVVNE